MIDGGIVLFLLSVLLACMAPAERVLTSRRHHAPELSVVPLTAAFPIAPPSPSLEALAHAADDALDAPR